MPARSEQATAVSPAVSRPRILVVYGTRPEAIKMAPLIRALRAEPDRFDPVVVTTAQHREMLDQVEAIFNLSPDLDLDLMAADQGLNDLTARVISNIDTVLADRPPDWVLVQGDTVSAMAAAVAGFHRRVPVGHVEAGLRTGDLDRPFPEEASRRIIDSVAAACFAPTERARDALLAEGIPPRRVHLTGNTVVDALESVAATLGDEARKDQVLVTVHRRESFGEPLCDILGAVRDLAARFPETRWICPVHMNPKVADPTREVLGGLANVDLRPPLDYRELVRCLRSSRLVLTDSGGLQEEAPTFGTPVLVLRDVTERPEGIDAGVARLVGTDPVTIREAATEVLTSGDLKQSGPAVTNPYGDGRAAERIVAVLAGDPMKPWSPPR